MRERSIAMRSIIVLGLALTMGACGLPRADEQTPINAVIQPDGTKLYTAGGLVMGDVEQVKQEISRAIAARCGSPIEITHWQAWDRDAPIRQWTEFEINAKCKGA